MRRITIGTAYAEWLPKRTQGELGAAYFGVAFTPLHLKVGQYPSVFQVTRKNRDEHPVFSIPWEANRWNPERSDPCHSITSGYAVNK